MPGLELNTMLPQLHTPVFDSPLNSTGEQNNTEDFPG